MVDVARRTYWCTLYESFRFTCGLDESHGRFTGGIRLGPEEYLTTFLGRQLSLNDDRGSIVANLEMVDEWCRLHLPDKFLERYDAAIATG
ncbi:hypothetical protein [Mesorhizobium japonicum]|uniref:hypothetical protein n=1 Tax=Mesorhizobium japonicum TaxID=2066070 RepID=UPI003B59CEC7